jgi:hypothetical protein
VREIFELSPSAGGWVSRAKDCTREFTDGPSGTQRPRGPSVSASNRGLLGAEVVAPLRTALPHWKRYSDLREHYRVSGTTEWKVGYGESAVDESAGEAAGTRNLEGDRRTALSEAAFLRYGARSNYTVGVRPRSECRFELAGAG